MGRVRAVGGQCVCPAALRHPRRIPGGSDIWVEIERKSHTGTSLVVQWLGLQAFTAVGPGLIAGGELRSCMPRGTAKIKNKNKIT